MDTLVRQAAEAEQLIDLAETADLWEIHLTSEEGYDLHLGTDADEDQTQC